MKWRRRVDTLFRRTPDGILVIGLDGGDPIWLPPPGDAVWELLDEARSVDALVADLSERFRASPDEVRADCRVLLADLRSKGLVEVEPS